MSQASGGEDPRALIGKLITVEAEDDYTIRGYVTSYDSASGKHSVTNQATGDRLALALGGAGGRKYTIERGAGGGSSAGWGAEDNGEDDEQQENTTAPAPSTGTLSSSSKGNTRSSSTPVTSSLTYTNPYYTGAYGQAFSSPSYNYNYSSYGGASSYIPTLTYKPKNPQARMVCTFRVLVDPRALRPGDRVTVTGSVAELTHWGDGVDMHRLELLHDTNLLVYAVQIEMPFSPEDHSEQGIFQLRYNIIPRGASGREEAAIPEGQLYRLERKCRPHFYHILRSQYKSDRFHAWVAPTSRDAFGLYVRDEVANFRAGRVDAQELLLRYDGLHGSMPEASSYRGWIEEVFDEYVSEAKGSSSDALDTPLHRVLLLCLAAMVGKFGLTSKEKEYVTGGDTRYTYTYYGVATTGAAAKVTFKKPPKPRPWCRFLLAELDVLWVVGMNLKDELGEKHGWLGTGLTEVVERFSEHGSFSWLTLMPIIDRYQITPTLADKEPTKAVEEEFHRVAALLVARMASLQRDYDEAQAALRAAEVAQAMERAKELEGGADDALDAVAELEGPEAAAAAGKGEVLLPEKRLWRAWMRHLILHAPTFQAVSDLLLVIRPGSAWEREVGFLAGPLADKVQDYDWEDHHLPLLERLLKSRPNFRGPRMGTAVLRSYAIGQELGSAIVMRLLRLCLEEEPSDSSRQAAHNLEGEWLQLNTAAKEWVQACHGTEKKAKGAAGGDNKEDDEDEDDEDGWISYWAKTYKYPVSNNKKQKPKAAKPPPPSAEELATKRRQALECAARDVDLLLTLDLFQRHPRGLLFELSRCWPLKGEERRVFDAVCTLVYSTYHTPASSCPRLSRPLEQYLLEVARSYVRHAAATQPPRVILDGIKSCFPTRVPPAESLLYILALSCTWPHRAWVDTASNTDNSHDSGDPQEDAGSSLEPPSLEAVLANADLWIELHQWTQAAAAVASAQPGLVRSSSSSLGGGATLTDDAREEARTQAQMAAVVSRVESLILATAQDIVSGAILLRTLHTTLHNHDNFLALLRCIAGLGGRQPSVDGVLLASRAEELKRFDSTLEQVQCFASLFCNCAGVRVDTAELRARVEGIRARYSSLRFLDMADAFGGAVEVLPYVDWLFQLRSSELFLLIWRCVGVHVALERVEGPRSGRAEVDLPLGEDGELPTGMDIALRMIFMESILGAEDDEDEDSSRSPSPPPQPSQRASPEEVLRKVLDCSSLETKEGGRAKLDAVQVLVLSQSDVCRHMIPRAQSAWAALAHLTLDLSIPITLLAQTYGRLDSPAHILAELRALAATADTTALLLASSDGSSSSSPPGLLPTASKPGTPRGAMESSVKVASEHLQDFFLLKKLSAWLPALLALHTHLADIFQGGAEQVGQDPLHVRLRTAKDEIKSSWTEQTLSTLSGVVKGVGGVFDRYRPEQLDFLKVLGESPSLVRWLLDHASTEEFNRLLQVVRPCTDEPRLLSSIASLVQIRTLLLPVLYVDEPYPDLQAFLLKAFAALDLATAATAGTAGGDSESCMWHLRNIVSSFEGLMDVFEKQTRSPGIKSCYDLQEIRERGTFVLRTCADVNRILSLEVAPKPTAPPPSTSAASGDDQGPEQGAEAGGASSSKVEPLEFLLDLRSKLLMTEIPAELEEEMQASVMVDAFVAQLQVLSDIRDALSQLYSSGHLTYQAHEQCYPFELDGLPALQAELNRLQEEMSAWRKTVKEARDAYYFLNFFTMREILRLRELALLAGSEPEPEEEEAACSAGTGAAALDEEEGPAASIENDQQLAEATTEPALEGGLVPEPEVSAEVTSLRELGFEDEYIHVALRRTNNSVMAAVEFLLSNMAVLPRLVEEDAAQRMAEEAAARQHKPPTSPEQRAGAANVEDPFLGRRPRGGPRQAMEELLSLLYLAASSVDREAARQAAGRWRDALDQGQPLLASLGEMLGGLFGPKEGGGGGGLCIRAIPRPSKDSLHASDMLISVDHTGEKRTPLFVACAESEALVMDVTLSVFARRGRLPEPGEVLFCTHETADEELELLLRRFLGAKANGRGEQLQVLADLHNLTYTQQCFFLDRLKAMAHEYGTEQASTLLLLSGRPRQLALNALSSQAVELPPLDKKELGRICSAALQQHYGETLAVASTINGGGKTHYIMRRVAEQQAQGSRVAYQRVPVRESSNTAKLVDLLTKAEGARQPPGWDGSSYSPLAIHLDISHIIPATANTTLFQLLVVGLLRDPVHCRVYHRNALDLFLLEIPNSPGDKTAHALHLSWLLPRRVLEVTAQSLDLKRPVFRTGSSSRIGLPDYLELVEVCKWLRAYRADKFVPGSSYDPDWTVETDEPMAKAECFDILVSYCCQEAGRPEALRRPSWSLLGSFVHFMARQFQCVGSYALFAPFLLRDVLQDMAPFKPAFIRMLIETSRDFSLRSVPQHPVVGPEPLPPAEGLDDQEGEEEEDGGQGAGEADNNRGADGGGAGRGSSSSSRVQSQAGGASRSSSRSSSTGADDRGARAGGGAAVGRRHGGQEDGPGVRDNDDEEGNPLERGDAMGGASYSEAARQAALTQPPEILRGMSEEMVERFANMLSWEDSEHPVVVFNMSSPTSVEVSGLDLLSLNPRYVDRYVSGELRQIVHAQGIQFDKDWSRMSNAEGVRLLRAVEGLGADHAGGVGALESGYVLTVDNLLKMLSIQLRMRFDLPVVIMGETGCGKSTLIRNLCAILGLPLHILNVHGGMEDTDILQWMSSKVAIAKRLGPHNRIVLFLDEVNTCNAMGLFKEMVCDRTMNGQPLPENVKLIAACNPYRLRRAKSLYGGEEMAGLVFEHYASNTLENVGTGIRDPLRNLVYRVHPLPESMTDHVYDFGALTPETERIYIRAMLEKQLLAAAARTAPTPTPQPGASEDSGRPRVGTDGQGQGGGGAEEEAEEAESLFGDRTRRASGQRRDDSRRSSPLSDFVDVFCTLICAAQECIRNLCGGERSAASLRDVARCVKVFCWFGEHLASMSAASEDWTLQDFFSVNSKAHKAVRKSVILSLAYCYHARLPRAERRRLVDRIVEAYRAMADNTPSSRHHHGRGGSGVAHSYYGSGLYGGSSSGNRGGSGGRWCRWLALETQAFEAVLEQTQREFVSKMHLEEGIALNEALCENLFMIMVSLLNQIPIFVIGKPGSSKSLAMGLVQSNMNGDASENEFLKSLPAVEVFSYQCSPLSTSQGIEQAFETARRYKREAENTVVVVLLDEVGLAEQSPHLPLKVLHKMLDEAAEGEAVVGISNWQLDASKMSRAVHLYRPAPTVEDLSLTAQGMVRSANLKGYLNALARAYNQVYHEQAQADFWGLREFYSTVRAINAYLNGHSSTQGAELEGQEQQEGKAPGDPLSSEPGSGGVALTGAMLLKAILRNYGGRPSEMEEVVSTFFDHLGLPVPHHSMDLLLGGGQDRRHTSTEALIRENLQEAEEARHLMLLTKNNAALGMLLDQGILNHDRTEIIFGSDFPLDQTDLQICLNIQQIKLCMAEGIPVVLIHCENLYESCYDLFNQHTVEYGGQQYVRLAFGTNSRLCPLHRKFRVIVIVEKVEAYTRLAPPLLNRFEKQVFERKDLLRVEHEDILYRLRAFLQLLTQQGPTAAAAQEATGSGGGSGLKKEEGGCTKRLSRDESSGTGVSFLRLRSTFVGYHSDLLGSLILAIENRIKKREQQQPTGGGPMYAASSAVVLQQAIEALLWIVPPEALCRIIRGAPTASGEQQQQSVSRRVLKEYGVNLEHTYFREQKHGSLPALVESEVFGEQQQQPGGGDWQDEHGTQMVVMTYAPVNQRAGEVLTQLCPQSLGAGGHVEQVMLHELDMERTLRQRVNDFFQSAQDGHVLLVQCDPLAASLRRIEHTKFIIENARAKFVMKKKTEQEAAEARATVSVSPSPHPPSSVPAPSPGGQQQDSSGVEETKQSGAPPGPVPAAPQGAREEEEGEQLPRTHSEELLGSAAGHSSPSRAGGGGAAASSSRRLLKGVHVLLLIHLPRGSDGVNYCVSFDARWRYVFVDSVASADAAGLPDFESIIGRSLKDIVSSLDLRKALLRACRPALARLSYPYSRTNEDVRDQIVTILRKLEEPTFLAAVRSKLEGMMDTWGTDLDLAAAAMEDRELQLAGTFQATLHSQVLEAVAIMFATLLAHVERNGGLQLLGSCLAQGAQPLCDLWYHLLDVSFREMRVSPDTAAATSTSSSSRSRRRYDEIVVGNDSAQEGCRFECRFPFSFFLYRLVEGMRPVAEGAGEDSLAHQLELLKLGKGLPGRLESDLLERYCHDVTCMRFGEVEGLSRDEQARLMARVLHLAAPQALDGGSSSSSSNSDEPPSTLAAIHCRLWKTERVLQLYFNLLSSVKGAQSAVAEYLRLRSVRQLDSKTHLGVLQIVLEHLAPWKQGWCEGSGGSLQQQQHYVEWVIKVEAAGPALEALMDFVPAGVDGRSEAESSWSKLLFYRALVRDVAVPLQLDARQVTLPAIDTWQQHPLVSQRALRHLLHVLGSINHQQQQQQSLTASEEASRRSSGRTRSNSSGGGAGGVRQDLAAFLEFFIFDVLLFTRPPSSGAQGPDEEGQHLLPLDLLEDLVLLLAGRGAELVPSLPASALPGVLPSEACRSGLVRELLAVKGKSQREVVQSKMAAELHESVRALGLLDAPLCVRFASVVEDSLLTAAAPPLQDYHDLAVIKKVDLTSYLRAPKAGSAGASWSLEKLLETVARIRHVLCTFADHLCDTLDKQAGEPSPSKPNSKVQDAIALEALVADLLLLPTNGDKASERMPGVNVGLVRSMRLFLLKQLERRRGVSFVRSALQQPPLCTSAWLAQWKAAADEPGLVRFVGENRLPRANPLASVPHFPRLQAVIDTYLSTGDASTLASQLLAAKEEEQQHQGAGPFKAALGAALFHECFLFGLLPDCHKSKAFPRIQGLRQFLRASPALSFLSEHERSLLLLLTGGARAAKPDDDDHHRPGAAGSWNAAEEILSGVDSTSSSEAVLRARVLAHVACLLLATGEAGVLSLLRTLMLEPGKAKGTYLPTMPEDPAKMAQMVLGGRWYTCPSGHPFFVDLCGRPTVVNRCAECGEEIGGLSHNLLATNREMGRELGEGLYQRTELEDRSERDYCIRSPQDEAQEPYLTVRTLQPINTRVVRLLLHSALVLGAATGGEVWLREARGLLNPAYCTSSEAQLPTFLAQHFTQDWRSLRAMTGLTDDDLATALHVMLVLADHTKDKRDFLVAVKLSRPGPTDSSRGVAVAGGAADLARAGLLAAVPGVVIRDGTVQQVGPDLLAREGSGSLAVLATPEMRRTWERAVDNKLITKVLLAEGLPTRLSAALALWGDGDESSTASGSSSSPASSSGRRAQQGLFTTELRELFDVDSLDKAERQRGLHALWRFRRPFSFDHFVNALHMQPDSAARYPLLTAFIAQEPQLRSLQYLPAVFRWTRLVMKRFNRKLDREAARALTVGQAIQELGNEHEQCVWREAYEQFARAWNDHGRYARRYECLTIPEDFLGLSMSLDTPLAFSLMSDKDEGIVPLALAGHLVETHNDLLQSAYQQLLLRGRDVERQVAYHSRGGRPAAVASKHLSQAQTIRYDLDEYKAFLAKQCVLQQQQQQQQQEAASSSSSGAGTHHYDFSKAEARLMDRYLVGLPIIELEAPLFAFSVEQSLSGGLELLKAKVRQEDLPPELAEGVRRELSPPSAQSCLRTVETAVSFLTSTGGAVVHRLDAGVREMTLGRYLQQVLVVPDAEAELQSRLVAQEVRLKHLASLWRVLVDLTQVDFLADVDARYRQALSEEEEEELRAACDRTLKLDILLPVLKDYISKHLSGSTYQRADEYLKVILQEWQYDDDVMEDLPWFRTGFPEKLPVSKIVATYQFVEKLQHA